MSRGNDDGDGGTESVAAGASQGLAEALLRANQELRAAVLSNAITKGLVGLGVGVGLMLFVFKRTPGCSTY